MQAIADAEEARQLQKKRRTRWLWVGIICLFLYSMEISKKKNGQKAGFNGIKEYEQHLKDKQREEEEKLLQKAAEEAGFNSIKEHKSTYFIKKLLMQLELNIERQKQLVLITLKIMNNF